MTVFITGASSGIGEACARAFAAARKDLILAARREDRLQKLKEELKSEFKVGIQTFALDVRDRAHLEKVINENTEFVIYPTEQPGVHPATKR